MTQLLSRIVRTDPPRPAPTPAPRAEPDSAADRFRSALSKAETAQPRRRAKTREDATFAEGAVADGVAPPAKGAQRLEAQGGALAEPISPRIFSASPDPAPPAPPPAAGSGAFDQAMERVSTPSRPSSAELALRFVNDLGPLAGLGVQRLPDGALGLSLAYSGAGTRPSDKALEALRRRLALQGLDLASLSLEEASPDPAGQAEDRT